MIVAVTWGIFCDVERVKRLVNIHLQPENDKQIAPLEKCLRTPMVMAWLESMIRLEFWNSYRNRKSHSMIRLESRFLVTRTTLRNDVVMARHKSRFFIEWVDSTRVTVNDLWLESESFLQNLHISYWQTELVCTWRNDLYLLQWPMINIGANFRLRLCLLVVLCYCSFSGSGFHLTLM